ncbi:MAG: TolC family protein [Chlamydiales bacterium]
MAFGADQEVCDGLIECPETVRENPNTIPRLSLNDVIRQTIKYQWTIQSSELAIDAQAGVLEQATGAFNPFLDTSYAKLFQRDIQSAIGLKSGLNGYTSTSNLSLQTLARLGTTYGITYQNVNTLNPLTLTPLRPPRIDASTVNLTVTQPLLRNLLYSPQTTLEKTQQLQLKAVKFQNIQNIAQAIASSITAYWEFVAARKLLVVQWEQEQLLCTLEEYAEDLVNENQQGYASLYQPRADLALATANRIQAEQNVRATYYALLLSMGLVPGEQKEIPDLLVDDFPISDSLCVLDRNWYDRYLNAIDDNRTDIIAAKILIEQADLNLISAKNSLLPAVDVTGTAQLLNTTAAQRARHLFESSNFRNPERDYTVGVSLTFPIFNDTAKGLVKQTRALKSQAVVNADFLESQAISDFKTAFTLYNALLSEVKRIRLSAKDYRLTVESEYLKLKEGLSTYFFVLTLQTFWQQALIQQIFTEKLFAENLVQMQLSSGKLIKWISEDKEIEPSDVDTTTDMFLVMGCETMGSKPSESCTLEHPLPPGTNVSGDTEETLSDW